MQDSEVGWTRCMTSLEKQEKDAIHHEARKETQKAEEKQADTKEEKKKADTKEEKATGGHNAMVESMEQKAIKAMANLGF